MSEQYDDILYTVEGPAAIITINRPQRYNAFRAQTGVGGPVTVQHDRVAGGVDVVTP